MRITHLNITQKFDQYFQLLNDNFNFIKELPINFVYLFARTWPNS